MNYLSWTFLPLGLQGPGKSKISSQFILLCGSLGCCFPCTRTGCTLYWLSCLVFPFSGILHLNVYLLCWISCVLKCWRVQLLLCLSCIFGLILLWFFACSSGYYFSQVILGGGGVALPVHFWLGNIFCEMSSVIHGCNCVSLELNAF